MPLPEGFNSTKYIHAPDEQIPIETLNFGANIIYELLKRFE